VEVADGLQQLLHRLDHVAVDDGPLGEQLHTREAVEVDDSRLFLFCLIDLVIFFLFTFIDLLFYPFLLITKNTQLRFEM
jgi:hypothetical protein